MPYIKGKVAELVEQSGTNNPFEIASQKNITVLYSDLGDTLGFFFAHRRSKFIHLHNGSSESKNRFVCAHELGHVFLHPGISTPFMRKCTLLSVDRIEKEANTFAIRLLTYNANIIEGETKKQFYLRHGVPIEMLDNV